MEWRWGVSEPIQVAPAAPPSATIVVPNAFPKRTPARRLAIIADSPSRYDASWQVCPGCGNGAGFAFLCQLCHEPSQLRPTPLVGPAGSLLNMLLSQIGISRDKVFVGHLYRKQAPSGILAKLKWDSEELAEERRQLGEDLRVYRPHFCLLLDQSGYVIRHFRGEKGAVDKWRGSLFMSQVVPAADAIYDDFLRDWSATQPVKCMAAYHPAAIQKDYGLSGVARFDMKRLAEELRTDAIELAEDQIEIDLSVDQMVGRLADIRVRRLPITFDLEGYVDRVSCIGFGTSANAAFVIPFIRRDGTSWWDDAGDEVRLWQAVAEVLEDPLVPKVAQNSLYDLFVLAWSYGIVVRGVTDDTMLKHFELFPELEKKLGFQVSIYTKHPFYKAERKSEDYATRLIYCGKDCCRTFECNDEMEKRLLSKQREHYQFNLSLLPALLYMELRGIKYDKTKAEEKLATVQEDIWRLQDEVNREAAKHPSRAALRAFLEATETSGDLVPFFRDAFCLAKPREKREVEEVSYQPMRFNGKKWVRGGKRVQAVPDSYDTAAVRYDRVVKSVERSCEVEIGCFEDVRRFSKDSCAGECKRAIQLARACEKLSESGRELASLRGELASLLSLHLKVNATGRGRDTEDEDGTLTPGEEKDANWYLYECLGAPKQYKKEGVKLTDKLASDDEAIIKAWVKCKDDRLMTFLRLRQLITQTKTLRAACDRDGRIRCGYNLVGTETHRLACYESPTGSGYNLQTVTKSHRDLFLADDAHWMCQRDLSGADGWTVAAYCAMLGDTTMLEDYRAKLKPAQILVLLHEQGPRVNQVSRADLKPLCAPITEETRWEYFAFKRVQHGGSYGMRGRTMSDQILTDAFKKGGGKPIFVDPKVCDRMIDNCLFARYPGLPRWHAWMTRELKTNGKLVASNGFQRSFYGRKDDHGTLKQALAHLPQVYTTYATTLAVSRLWLDPENRRPDGSLIVEPLHTVHDSLITQWHKDVTEWAKAKMKAWFENPIKIAQETLVIPASGSYGPDWKHQDYSL
jgi:uracil-DNA glycosylase family 4